jgi:MFS family permease
MMIYLVPILSNVFHVYTEAALAPLISTVLGNRQSDVIMLTSILYGMSVVGYVVMSKVSRWIGLRNTMIVVMLLNILSSIVAIVGENEITTVIIGRAISGLAVTSLLAQTWMNYVGSDDKSLGIQALFNVTFYIGWILGTMVAGLASEYMKTYAWTFVNQLAAVFFSVTLIVCIFVHEPSPDHCKWTCSHRWMSEHSKPVRVPSMREIGFRTGNETFHYHSILGLVYCEYVTGISEGVFYSVFSIYMGEYYHFSDLKVALVYVAIAVTAIAINIWLVPRFESCRLAIYTIVVGYGCLAVFCSYDVSAFIILNLIVKGVEQVIFSVVRVKEQLRIPEVSRVTVMVFPMTIFLVGCVTGIAGGIAVYRNVSMHMVYIILATLYATAALASK